MIKKLMIKKYKKMSYMIKKFKKIEKIQNCENLFYGMGPI